MTKTINEETDLRLLGLLTYLSLNKDENGFVCLGCRELSRRTGMSEKWIRTAVKKLEDYKVLKMQPSALSPAPSSALNKYPKTLMHMLFTSKKENSESAPSSALSSAPNEDENNYTLRSYRNVTDRTELKGTKPHEK